MRASDLSVEQTNEGNSGELHANNVGHSACSRSTKETRTKLIPADKLDHKTCLSSPSGKREAAGVEMSSNGCVGSRKASVDDESVAGGDHPHHPRRMSELDLVSSVAEWALKQRWQSAVKRKSSTGNWIC